MTVSENVDQVALATTSPAVAVTTTAPASAGTMKAGAFKKSATKRSKVKKTGGAGGAKIPTTGALVIAAIQELKEKKGSSAAAIKRFVAQKSGRELTAAFNSTVNKNLAKMMKAGQLISGAPAGRKGAGCFKLAPEEKQRLANNARAQAKKAAALAAGKVVKKSAGAKKAGTKKKSGVKVAKKAGQKVVKKVGGAAGKKGAQVPILYLRDVLHHLAQPETVQGLRCLQLVPQLAQTHLPQEDPSLAVELLKLLLYAENRTDSPSWLPHQKGAVQAVTVARPLPALSLLIPAIFDMGNTLNTKFLVTDCLVGAAVTLQDNSHPELGRYIALAVAGLAAGGGGSWGDLRVGGLDSALLAQVVTGAGALVRVGARCLGWEGVARDYLELLLGVTGRGRGPVAAAVVGGLATVTALVAPRHLVEGGRLGALLAEGAAWAVGLEGELGAAAGEVLGVLAGKRQEALRMEVEESLQPSQEIRMTVPGRRVRLN